MSDHHDIGKAGLAIAVVLTVLIVALALLSACELSEEMPRQCADLEARKTDPACARWDV